MDGTKELRSFMEIINITQHDDSPEGVLSGFRSIRGFLKSVIAEVRMHRVYRTAHLNQGITLPKDLNSSNSVLIAVPEGIVDSILCLPEVMEIIDMNPEASVSILCEEEVLPVFGGMDIIRSVYVYRNAEAERHKYIWYDMGRRLSSEEFDITFLLSEQPGKMLKFMVTATLSKIRVGFATAAEYPCCNLIIKNSSKKGMIEIISSSGNKRNLKWDLSEGKEKETELLFREQHLSGKSNRCGIDIEILRKRGRSGKNVEKMLEELENIGYNVYLYSYSGAESDMKWVERLERPFFSGLSIAGTAGVVQNSRLIISPAGVFAGIANISGVNTIMLTEDGEKTGGFAEGGNFLIMEFNRLGSDQIESVVETAEKFLKHEQTGESEV